MASSRNNARSALVATVSPGPTQAIPATPGTGLVERTADVLETLRYASNNLYTVEEKLGLVGVAGGQVGGPEGQSSLNTYIGDISIVAQDLLSRLQLLAGAL
jgi:hypothetical protein